MFRTIAVISFIIGVSTVVLGAEMYPISKGFHRLTPFVPTRPSVTEIRTEIEPQQSDIYKRLHQDGIAGQQARINAGLEQIARIRYNYCVSTLNNLPGLALSIPPRPGEIESVRLNDLNKQLDRLKHKISNRNNAPFLGESMGSGMDDMRAEMDDMREEMEDMREIQRDYYLSTLNDKSSFAPSRPPRPDAMEILNEIAPQRSYNYKHQEEIENIQTQLNDLHNQIQRTKYNIYISNLNNTPYLGE